MQEFEEKKYKINVMWLLIGLMFLIGFILIVLNLFSWAMTFTKEDWKMTLLMAFMAALAYASIKLNLNK